MRRILAALGFTLWLALLLPAFAAAATGSVQFPTDQVVVLIVGLVSPALAYAVNHWAPWASEPVKALVLAVIAGVAGAVTAAANTNVFGFNNATLQLVLTAVVAAFAAHHLFWKPSGIAAKLGAGSNVAPKAHR